MFTSVSVTNACRKFARLLDRVERGERVIITRYGKRLAAIVPLSDLKLLVQSKASLRKIDTLSR